MHCFYRRAPLDNENGKKETILLPDTSANSRPMDLTMDWLNNHLYILEEIRIPVSIHNRFVYKVGDNFIALDNFLQSQKIWRISRCDLNGAGLTVVLAGLMKQPSHIEVDPYNG